MSLYGGQSFSSLLGGEGSQTPYEHSTSTYSTQRISTGVWPLLSPSLLIGTQPSQVSVTGGPAQLLKSTDADFNTAASPPLRRFSVNVAPLAIQNIGSSNSSADTLLLDFDTQDLYTDNGPQLGNLGTPWSPPTATPGGDCTDKYGEGDGVYSSPMPIRGAPMKLQKVYFAGSECGDKVTNNGYYAYFLCSSPIENATSDCTDPATCSNPRNANWNYMEGVDKEWSGINIGAGCSSVYSSIAGTGYINEGTQYYETGLGQISQNKWGEVLPSGGCDNILIFSGNCNAISSIEQIKFTDDNYPLVTGRYATVVKLFEDYITTGVGLCLGNGDIVSGDILFRPY